MMLCEEGSGEVTSWQCHPVLCSVSPLGSAVPRAIALRAASLETRFCLPLFLGLEN